MSILTEQEVRAKAQARARYFSESTGTRLGKALDNQWSVSTFDVFLSHAFRDAEIVQGIKDFIEDMGKTVYVDWIDDPHLDRNHVTAATANQLRLRMTQCRVLVFITTSSSPDSKWMPWELGYFDALRNRVSVFPIESRAGQTIYRGQEYLGLYPYITQEPVEGSPKPVLWVNRTPTRYVRFTSWVEGKDPSDHPH